MSSESAPAPGKVSRRSLALAGIVAGLVVVFVVVNGVWSRNASEAKLKERTDAQSVPTVAVIEPDSAATSPRSICRAASKPIRGRRSMPASAAS